MTLSSDIAIELKNVFEKYDVELTLDGKTVRESFEALRDISFAVRKGEGVAVIGPNGAGKSTLLRLIAGLISPEKGEVKVHGRVGSLLDLGAGFHPELTGRDNLLLNASLYHFSREELDEKYEDILKFADIGKFINAPVRCYSQGMYVRLAFSLAIHVDPDIILIDDCLAVGDDRFRLKCIDRVLELKTKNKTIVLVTHDFDLARQICSRGIYLRDSRIVQDGAVQEVAALYLKPAEVDKQLYRYLSAKILEDEQNRKAEEEKRIKEEEARRKLEEEKRLKEEEAIRKLEEEKRLVEEAARRKLEEERHLKVEEERLKLEADSLKREEEQLRLEEERILKEEANRQRLEEERQKLEAEHKRLEEVRYLQSEEERLRLEADRRKLEAEYRQLNEERIFKEEEERLRLEADRRKLEEERILKEEADRQRLEEERQKLEAERQKLEAEHKQLEEVRRVHEEEDRRNLEEDRRNLEEDRRNLEEERGLRQGENRKLEAEHRKLEAEHLKLEQGHLKLEQRHRQLDEERILTGENTVRDPVEERKRNEEEKVLLRKEKRKQGCVLSCGPSLKFKISPFKVQIIHKDREITSRDGMRTHFRIEGETLCSDGAIWRIQKISEKEVLCCLRWRKPKKAFQVWRFRSLSNGNVDLEILCGRSTALLVQEETVNYFLKTSCEIFGKDLCHNKGTVFACGSMRDFRIETLQKDQICGIVPEGKDHLRAYFMAVPDRSSSGKAELRQAYFKGRFCSGVLRANIKGSTLPSHKVESSKTKVEFHDGSCQLIWDGECLTTGLGLYTSLYSRGNWYDSTQARWKFLAVSRGGFVAKGFWPWLPIAQTWKISVKNGAMIHWRVQMEVFGEVPIHMQETVMMMSPQYKKWSAGREVKVFPNEATQDDFFRVSLWDQKADGVSSVSVRSDSWPAVTFQPAAMPENRIIVENSEHIYGLKSRLFHCLCANKKKGIFLLPGTYDFFQGVIHIKEENA